MSDDTRRILELLAKGKITVGEAEELMRALDARGGNAAAEAAEDGACPKPRWVLIKVHKTAREGKQDQDVNIRVPIAVVKSGMRLGALIPGLAGDQVAARLREKGLDVDFSKLDAASIDAMLKELGETNIEIESGRSHVRITCE
jgi:SHOCT-like protein